MPWHDIIVSRYGGEHNYFTRTMGITENGKYRIMGSIPQNSITDDRFKLAQQFRMHGTNKIRVGDRLVAQVLEQTAQHQKHDYVLLPGIVKSIYPPQGEWMQLRFPFIDE